MLTFVLAALQAAGLLSGLLFESQTPNAGQPDLSLEEIIDIKLDRGEVDFDALIAAHQEGVEARQRERTAQVAAESAVEMLPSNNELVISKIKNNIGYEYAIATSSIKNDIGPEDCSVDIFDSFRRNFLERDDWQRLMRGYVMAEALEPQISQTSFWSSGQSLDVCHLTLQYESSPYPSEQVFHSRDKSNDVNIELAMQTLAQDATFQSHNHRFILGSIGVATYVADGPYSSTSGYGIVTNDGLYMVEMNDTYWFSTAPYIAQENGEDSCPCKKVLVVTVTVPLTEKLLSSLVE